MKNLLCTRSLILVFLLLSVQGFSQDRILSSNHSKDSKLNFVSPATYEPFISESKQWKFVQKTFLTGGGGSDGAYHLVQKFYFKGDTIVDNIKYSKLYKQQEQPLPWKGYMAYLIHEDILDQKVFVFDPSFKKHALLYDFKLNKGDEFNIYILSNIYSKHTVVKVDTITTSNKKLKRIEFDDQTTWIEGIGCVTGGYVPFESELICVRVNNDLLYMNPKFSNCDTIFTQGTWDNIQSIHNTDVMVFPNPVVSTSVVRVNSNNHEPLKIEIYSYSGALIKEDYFSGDYPIGLVQLTKGMYVYRVTLGNKVIQMDKIIVVSQ